MKKLFSLLTLALLTMSAWAATNTYSYTFGSKTFSADGTATLNGVEWTLATVATDDGYYGYDGTKGQQFGSGSKPCSEVTLSTSGISGTITKVTVNASTGSQATATMEVTVGGDSFISTDLTSTATNYSGTGSATGEVVIKLEQPNTSKALYIKSIEIVYEGEAVSVAAPVFNPNGGKFSVNSLEVTVTCADSPCDIYVFEGDQVDWTANYWYYSGPFYVTETKTYTAIAYKGSAESNPTTVTFTKVDPAPAYTFLPNEYDAVTQKPFSIEKDGVTFACTQGTITEDDFRIFKNQTATFTAGEGVADIVKIEFTCTADNGPENFTMVGENGTYTYEDNIGTWTGKTNSVAFLAATKQVRATKIVFTLDDGTTAYVLEPTLPESCEFENEMTVTITNNEEGSTLMYALNDGEYAEYSAPFTINQTTTVKAYAEYEGIRSNVVSATYTLVEPEDITTLAQVNALDNNTEFEFKGDAVVTVQEGQYLWLRDASGYGLIFGTLNAETNTVTTFENGQVLAQGWTANKTTYNGLTEYKDAAGLNVNGTNAELAAIQTITELSADMINAYVQVLNVKSFTVSGKNVTANFEDGTTMVMYNQFSKEIPTAEGNYTVKGAVGRYAKNTTDQIQLYIISIEGYEPEVYDVNSIAEAYAIPENATFTMFDEMVVTYQKGNRLWIRDTEGTSGMIYGDLGATFENGQVLTDGWSATYAVYNNVPEFTNPEDVEADGDNTRDAAPYERTTITNANVNEYVIMKGITLLTDTTNAKRFYNAADSLVIFNSFNVEIPEVVEGKTYDVTGIVTIYYGKPQVYITEMTEVATAGLRGDVNDDKAVNISDVTALIDYLLNPATEVNLANADCNTDTAINISDVTALIDYLLSGAW